MINELEKQLNDFNPAVRREALLALAAQIENGSLPAVAEVEAANLHCHTFYSFNAYGYSPSGLAWLAKQRGYLAIGMIDFDVLDGVDEFLDACQILGVRGTASLETRTYVPEFSTREINSPGEPGIYYHMGIGFTSHQAPSPVQPILANLRERAEQRNREMLKRLNAFLAPLQVDYEQDVLPLTPQGNATERHMLTAIITVVAKNTADPIQYWSDTLGMPAGQVTNLMQDSAKFQNQVRMKLMKKGGVGYVQPVPANFPSVPEVNQLTTACQALPCATFLDGTSTGEQAMEELLALMISQGAVALNIIPDRNWNIADPDAKQLKLRKLYEVVELAHKLDLPTIVGTEMNSPGQKMVDDFDVPELASVRQSFLDGAYFLYGHTILQRSLGLGYQSAWAKTHFPSRKARNAFFTQAGKLVPAGNQGIERLKQWQKVDLDPDPRALLGINQD